MSNLYELNKEWYIRIQISSGVRSEFRIGENFKNGAILAAPKVPPLLYQDDVTLASISENNMKEISKVAEEFQKEKIP